MGREGYIAAFYALYDAVGYSLLAAPVLYALAFIGVHLGHVPDPNGFDPLQSLLVFRLLYRDILLGAALFSVCAAVLDTVNALLGKLAGVRKKLFSTVYWPGRFAIILAAAGYVVLYWTIYPWAGPVKFVFTSVIVVSGAINGWDTHA
jgi:hypothetical protein